MSFLRKSVAVLLAGLLVAVASSAENQDASLVVPFRMERAGVASINLYRADGTLARRLVESQWLPAGPQTIAWDGRTEDGAPAAAGEYHWKGIVHEGIGLKLRGWAANGGATPWTTADGKGDWGGDAGVPSAVAADAQHVYLGWSLAEGGRAVLACDLEGRVQWGHRRVEAASGCKALAVDQGVVFVLGGLAGADAEGGAIYRLDAKDGKPIPWPDGQIDLKIPALWPADARTRPAKADAMAVRNGHIYLTFTESEFLTVLDAKTGAYLQTVVGAPPGQIDVVATKAPLPDAPDKLVDADFAVIALPGGVLGKVLFAHDPLWVVTSELTAVQDDVRVNALSVIGDRAKFHQHEAFIGLGRPFHQIQARPLLDIGALSWIAGKAGGRPLLGPWEGNALRDIRGLALAGDGRLWVAEGDAFPKRFSVWDTTAPEGRLIREFFGPMDSGELAAAINPLDPDLMFAQGCEWRIDRQGGAAKCLGVVTREPLKVARFGVGENGRVYLATEEVAGPLSIFERMSDGDFRLRSQVYPAAADGTLEPLATAARTVFWADENDDGIAQSSERQLIPGVLRINGTATLQDLALTGSFPNASARAFAVESWSPCGAPRYDFTRGMEFGSGQISADNRFRLWTETSRSRANVTCQALGEPHPRWTRISSPAFPGGHVAGVAKLAEPLGNVWLMTNSDAAWWLINEDGFEIARFFVSDSQKAVWPNSADAGAEMAQAQGGRTGGLTQAADGKLYLQAGRSAAWNMEVTGLEKVSALAGGTVSLSAKK